VGFRCVYARKVPPRVGFRSGLYPKGASQGVLRGFMPLRDPFHCWARMGGSYPSTLGICHPPTTWYMPPITLPVGTPSPVHALRPQHAGPVPVGVHAGMTVLTEGSTVVGMVLKDVPKEAKTVVSVLKVSHHRAITGGFSP